MIDDTETPKAAARRLLSAKIARGYLPRALHEYSNADGQPIYWRARLEHPDGDRAPEGRKIIRPLHLNGHGYKLGEPTFPPFEKPLYNLHRIANDNAGPVWIVEGEKAADALAKLGAIATTSGGSESARAADWSPLAGRVCVLWPDNDDSGRAYMGEVAAILGPLGCALTAVEIAALNLPPKADAADWLAERPEATQSDLEAIPRLAPQPIPSGAPQADWKGRGVPPTDQPRAVLRRIADVQAKPIRWLWPGRFARGKVSMIAGHPGLGKSQITAALAAVVTTGGRWPVDRSPCERGSVILLNAEDDVADTIRPRLEAAEADLGRCEILDAVVDGYAPDGSPTRRGFSLKADLGVLDEVLAARSDVAMVVIDPITAYLNGVDTHVNADVRAMFAPLGEIASKHEVAIVCVSHLNKGSATRGGAGEALMRVSGSLAFVAAARAAFIVVRDQEDPHRRLFLPAKNNIGKDEAGLAFVVEQYALPSGIETSRVSWEPNPVSISADEAMAPAPDEEERSMSDEAVELLRDVVGSGRVPSARVKQMAREQGISDRALRTAREKLGLKTVREGYGAESKTFWLFPDGTFENPSVVPSDLSRAHMGHMAQLGADGTTGGRDGADGGSE